MGVRVGVANFFLDQSIGIDDFLLCALEWAWQTFLNQSIGIDEANTFGQSIGLAETNTFQLKFFIRGKLFFGSIDRY